MWIRILAVPFSSEICNLSELFSKLVATRRPLGRVVLKRIDISSACVFESSGIRAAICWLPLRCNVEASAKKKSVSESNKTRKTFIIVYSRILYYNPVIYSSIKDDVKN